MKKKKVHKNSTNIKNQMNGLEQEGWKSRNPLIVAAYSGHFFGFMMNKDIFIFCCIVNEMELV